jgi:hypothetical protein
MTDKATKACFQGVNGWNRFKCTILVMPDDGTKVKQVTMEIGNLADAYA